MESPEATSHMHTVSVTITGKNPAACESQGLGEKASNKALVRLIVYIYDFSGLNDESPFTFQNDFPLKTSEIGSLVVRP